MTLSALDFGTLQRFWLFGI